MLIACLVRSPCATSRHKLYAGELRANAGSIAGVKRVDYPLSQSRQGHSVVAVTCARAFKHVMLHSCRAVRCLWCLAATDVYSLRTEGRPILSQHQTDSPYVARCKRSTRGMMLDLTPTRSTRSNLGSGRSKQSLLQPRIEPCTMYRHPLPFQRSLTSPYHNEVVKVRMWTTAHSERHGDFIEAPRLLRSRYTGKR